MNNVNHQEQQAAAGDAAAVSDESVDGQTDGFLTGRATRSGRISQPIRNRYDDIDWDDACHKADVIRDFLRRVSGPTTTAQMRELAAELRHERARTY